MAFIGRQHRQLEIEISSKKDQIRGLKKRLDLLFATRPQGRG